MAAGIQTFKTIAAFLNQIVSPPTTLPPITKEQISLGMPLRPGLSALKITSRINKRKDESGAPQVPSQEDLRMERIRVEEIVKALITEAKVEVVIPENQIVVTVYSVTPAGPTPIGIGLNDKPVIGKAKGSGIIR